MSLICSFVSSFLSNLRNSTLRCVYVLGGDQNHEGDGNLNRVRGRNRHRMVFFICIYSFGFVVRISGLS